MGRFAELTEAQREPLFALVDYQREEGGEVVFEYEGAWDMRIFPKGRKEETITTVPEAYLDLWDGFGYVNLHHRQLGSLTNYVYKSLVLCQEGLDYERRMRELPFVRGLKDFGDAWATDLRALVIAVIGTILTAIALNLFGLLC